MSTKGGRPSVATAIERRKLFVEAYLANGEVGVDAWYAAGYTSTSRKCAMSAASRMLRRSDVADMLEKRRAELRKKYRLNAETVVAELARVIHFSPKALVDKDGNLLHLHELDDDAAAALSGVEFEPRRRTKLTGPPRLTKARAHNKTAAIEQAIKILGLYDRPPPTRDDEEDDIDEVEMVKGLAFLLEEQAHKQRRLEGGVKTVSGKRVNGDKKKKVIASS